MCKLLTLLGLFAFFDPGPALAQGTLTLDEAIQQALGANPLLLAQSQRVAAASGLVQQAGLRPNPRIYFQSENWSVSGADPVRSSANSDQFGYFTQPIELGGKRQKRVELSESRVKTATLEQELLMRQVVSRVKLAYWTAVGAEQVRDLWLEQQENFRLTIQYHEDRVREGALAQAELLRVRLEGDRFAVSAAAAALDVERAQIALLQAMGATEMRQVVLTTRLSDALAPSLESEKTATAERAEVKIARQDVTRAGADIRLQTALARPDVEVGIGYKRNLGFNTMIGIVQFNLPIFNKNQGNVRAAVSEERAARSSLTSVEAQVNAEVATARRDVNSKRHQLQDLLAGSRDRANESARIANAAYREGGVDLLRLLDAQRLRIDLDVLYTKTLTEYWQSVVALETALGANP